MLLHYAPVAWLLYLGEAHLLQWAGMLALCMWWLLMTLYWFSWARMPHMVSGRTLQGTPSPEASALTVLLWNYATYAG